MAFSGLVTRPPRRRSRRQADRRCHTGASWEGRALTSSKAEVSLPLPVQLTFLRAALAGWLTVEIDARAGYKISALDVENALLAHPAVREVAVVGIPDERLGQKVALSFVPPMLCPAHHETLNLMSSCARGR